MQGKYFINMGKAKIEYFQTTFEDVEYEVPTELANKKAAKTQLAILMCNKLGIQF